MTLSLQGRRVLITRAREGAGKAAQAFHDVGAVPVVAPTIETVPVGDAQPLRMALAALHADDWLVLTSPTAARIWAAMIPSTAVGARLAVIGEATAAVLREAGYAIALVSPQATGLNLAEAIVATGGGRHVLLPRSDKALPGLPERLRAAGYGTVDLALYQTVLRVWTEAEATAAAGVDAVTLMSPSSAAGLQGQRGIDGWLAETKLVAMGTTTAEAVRTRFGRIDAVAEPPSLAGLVSATAGILAKS